MEENLSVLLYSLAVIVIGTYLWMKVKNKLYSGSGQSMKLQNIPGPMGLPIIGHSFSVDVSRLHHTFYKLAKQYGAIFRLSIFGQNIVVMNDISLVRKAFSGDAPYGNVLNYRQKHFIVKYVLFNGASISFENFDKKTMILRKIVPKSLKIIGERSDKFENHMVKELDRLVSKLNKYDGRDCNLNTLLKESFATWMSALMTGYTAEDGDSDILWNFMESVNMLITPGLNFILEMCPFLRHLPGKPGRLFGKTLQTRDKLLRRFFFLDDKSRIETLKKGDGLVALFIKLQEEENEKAGYDALDDIRAFLLEIFFTGTDTTSTVLMNAFALLLRYPGYVKKLQDEIDSVVGQSRNPNLNDMENMSFARAFMFEVNRYTSQVPLGLPHKALNDVNFEGYNIKKNDLAYLNSWFIHHDETIWTDPWSFRPERFLDGRGELLPADHQFRQSMVPFGLGRRACPGETFAMSRIFMYITRMLQEFNFEPPSSGTQPQTDPRHFTPAQVLCVEDYLCKIVPRMKPV